MERDGDAIPTASPTFSTTSDSDMAMLTRRYIGRHMETQYQFRFSGRHFDFPMLVDVDSVIFKSGVVEIVAVGMVLSSHSVHALSG